MRNGYGDSNPGDFPLFAALFFRVTNINYYVYIKSFGLRRRQIGVSGRVSPENELG